MEVWVWGEDDEVDGCWTMFTREEGRGKRSLLSFFIRPAQ